MEQDTNQTSAAGAATERMTDAEFLKSIERWLDKIIPETPIGDARDALTDLQILVAVHNRGLDPVPEGGQRLCPVCHKPLKNPDAVKHFRCRP